MAKLPRVDQRVRFGVFDVDFRAGELRKRGIKIKLHGQPLEVLAMLLERPGEVVTREEIRQKLWPADTFVDFDHGLNKAVTKLREALGDDADNPRFVETLPRRGYRFIGAVEWEHRPRASPTGRIMLVVLPFDNLSGDLEQEYFADGMTEEMANRLGSLNPEHLGVIARTSAMQYKNRKKAASQIGRELGVDYLVEGSVRRSSSRVRISAQLIQARDQTYLWAASYERDLSDLLMLQSEVATAIAQQIQVQLTTQARAALARTRPVDQEAHDAYLRGAFFQNKLTVDGVKTSIKYFQQAIDKDPSYGMPYVGLAKAYGQLRNFAALPPSEAYANSKAAATKALEIDETVAEAHAQLAWSKVFYDRDWAGAERGYRRALELSPSDATAHQGYAMYFVAMGQLNEALAEIERAERLDPVSLDIKADKGWFLYYARQPDEAISVLRETLDMDPNFGRSHFFLAHAYELKGMFDQAIAEFQKSSTLFGYGSKRIASIGIEIGSIGHAYAVSGRQGEAMKVLGELERRSRREYVSPYHIALVHLALGDKDRAFAWLERAYQDRYWMMAFLKVDPRLDPLRSDPRYTDLLHRSSLVP